MRLLVALAVALLASPALAQQSHLLVVAGLGGEPRLREAFHEQAVSLATTAEKKLGLPSESVWCLTEKPEREPTVIDARSTRENVVKAVAALVARARPGDTVFLVLIGHGSYRGGEARFNLPGPDVSPEELLPLLGQLSAQRVVLVNTASASGAFLKQLAGPGRIIVTATKSGHERNETVFGEHFVAALTGDVADVDKDGRISVLEAFEYARREVERFYEDDNRLLTEHAQLDDDGDGEGSAELVAHGDGDGSLARRVFLSGPGTAVADEASIDDPALVPLYAHRRELEERIESLRLRKEQLAEARYSSELEQLLLELALKNEAIDAAGARP